MNSVFTICVFFILSTVSADVRTSTLDGEKRQEFNEFDTGFGGCARCIYIGDQVKCDISKCQQTSNVGHYKSVPDDGDFVNLKNQLVEKYFTQYDATKLKVILDMLGCKTSDCPQLLSASSIEYDITSLNRQEYIGRGDKQNKIVIHSTDAEAVNNSPSRQEITTVSYSLKVTQYYEATVTKTMDIFSEIGIQLKFIKFGASFKFGKTTSETRRQENETTLEAPAQKVIVEPHMKINVTFNYYEYDDINNYFLDFEIGAKSMITHPDVDAASNVIFVKKPIGEFLEKNVDFIPSLKYQNDTMIKLIATDGKFILKNFPATEKISNFGVDVKYGKPEKID